jgi:TatD DNase family protein
MMFIDTHCHLNYSPLFEKAEEIISRAQESEVRYIICVATDIETTYKAINLAEKFPNVYATAGIHPHDVNFIKEGWQNETAKILKHKKVLAIGEIGLDYYKHITSKDKQVKVFTEQVQMARSLKIPMVIHNRRADTGIRQILVSNNYYNGVLHCFSSNADFAEEMVELGLNISFTGNVTYGSKKTERTVKIIPLEKIMLETDAPFLSPAGKKDEINEPANISLIAKKIAELKSCSVNKVAKVTSENAIKFFKIPQ